MKYESDILEMIHENAIIDFKLGLISEAEMRKFDKLCLPEEALQDNTAKSDTHEPVNIAPPGLVAESAF
jgi:DNA-binding transcriptional regulator YiaG